MRRGGRRARAGVPGGPGGRAEGWFMAGHGGARAAPRRCGARRSLAFFCFIFTTATRWVPTFLYEALLLLGGRRPWTSGGQPIQAMAGRLLC